MSANSQILFLVEDQTRMLFLKIILIADLPSELMKIPLKLFLNFLLLNSNDDALSNGYALFNDFWFEEEKFFISFYSL